MRIQETNQVLKESRYARHGAAQQHDEGVFSRAWRVVANLPGKVTELFKKH